MTATLFDLTYKVASNFGIAEEGNPTGGTTGTIIDTNDRTEDNDYWNGGTAWVLYDAAGAGAAPEKELSIINDFDNGTSTVTLRNNLTVAVAAGDRHGIAANDVPLNIIIQKINQALLDLGVIPYTDITTITTADGQTEHELPISAGLDLREVWLQTFQDTNDNQWSKVDNWVLQRSTIGEKDLLILPAQYISNMPFDQ